LFEARIGLPHTGGKVFLGAGGGGIEKPEAGNHERDTSSWQWQANSKTALVGRHVLILLAVEIAVLGPALQ
jgi:hypothetical protein